MEIIFVRHCDPDYEKDSLTPVGMKEAELLSERIQALNADAFYCSPMGRAQKTAEISLRGTNAQIQTLDWLHEFRGMVWSGLKRHYCWDFLPSEWTKDKRNYTEDWLDSDIMKHGNVKKEYEKVCKGIDGLLEKYGYKHTGNTFEVIHESHDRIVFFCHFGISCVLLGYLLGISPIVLLHNFAALPSSVTRIVTEEREKGIASFRMLYYGDISHLYAKGQDPSFAVRFCECNSDDTRH